MKPENLGEEMQGNLFTGEFEQLRDPRGRKSFKPSPENRLLVSALRARGKTHKEIIIFMGGTDDTFCKDEKTFRKHFSRELEYGALFIEGMATQALVAKMMGGNMGAIKRLLEDSSAQPPAGKPKGGAKPAPLGKKAALEQSASTLPAGWGELLGHGKPVN